MKIILFLWLAETMAYQPSALDKKRENNLERNEKFLEGLGLVESQKSTQKKRATSKEEAERKKAMAKKEEDKMREEARKAAEI